MATIKYVCQIALSISNVLTLLQSFNTVNKHLKCCFKLSTCMIKIILSYSEPYKRSEKRMCCNLICFFNHIVKLAQWISTTVKTYHCLHHYHSTTDRRELKSLLSSLRKIYQQNIQIAIWHDTAICTLIIFHLLKLSNGFKNCISTRLTSMSPAS